jgi:diacylglycerol O-acyltransferase
MAYERLSPLDSGFLHIEDDVTHMHIGSVSIMEGPAPSYDEMRDLLASKLPLVRRYRQVVKRVPFDLGRPVWADDPYFDLEYHLRRTALPHPGGEPELCHLVGRIMGQQLDRSRPLWEMWMVEGLAGGYWAIVSKVHHCMADGVSGSDLFGLLLDLTPQTAPVEALPWMPGLPPAGWELAAKAVVDMATSPFELLRVARARTRLPRKALAELAESLSAVRATTGDVLGSASASSLNGPIGPHRRWVPAEVSVEQIKHIRARVGGSFNDVVLASITRGFRDLLEKRGEPVDLPVRTMVPVSVRARDERGMAVGDGTLANKVSAIFAELPVQLSDPVERLRAISEQMAGLKDSKRALAGEALTSLTGFAPPVLLSLAGRLLPKIPQSRVNTITTNVPGPQLPLYAAGRRMLRVYPFVPLGMQMRIAVAVFSYDGTVGFGVTGDYEGAPDVDVLAHGIVSGADELASIDPSRPTVIDLRPRRSGRRPAGGVSPTSRS